MQQYNNKRQDARKRHSEILWIATSADEARREYELVEQAMLALDDDAQCDDIADLTYPPLYAVGSSPSDTSTSPDSDDDDWMWLPLEELSLEHVLQAEQVLITLLQVKQWAQQTDVTTWLLVCQQSVGVFHMRTYFPS
jgi:hypothetical protein